MPKASVTRHIARDKQTLIDFVLDIEKYPEFIPFCIDSKVYETNDNGNEVEIIADLTIGKKPFIDTYKSNIYIYGIASNREELEIVINEAKSILDVNKVIASILLVEDLRIQKN